MLVWPWIRLFVEVELRYWVEYVPGRPQRLTSQDPWDHQGYRHTRLTAGQISDRGIVRTHSGEGKELRPLATTVLATECAPGALLDFTVPVGLQAQVSIV